MNTKKIIVVILLLIVAGPLPLWASQEMDTIFSRKTADFFEQIDMMNPWHLSKNPAGFVFYPANNINRIQLGYFNKNDNLRWAQAPGSTISYTAETEGIRRIGRVVAKGSFRYQNSHYRDILFNNTSVFDNRNIYTTGDTLGGPQRKEGYLMTAGAGLALKDNWFVGLDFDYSTGVGAKMQDPRNLNDQSRLDIIPGVIFRHGQLFFGLSGGPVWERNQVNIKNMLEERHSLFHMMGMGYYNLSRNISNESYLFDKFGLHGSVQFGLEKPGFGTFHTIRYSGSDMKRLEGSHYRLLAGITHRDELSYKGKILLEKERYLHHVNINASYLRLNGSEISQETYSVGEGHLRWFEVRTIRWIDDKHIVYDMDAGLSYQLIRLGRRGRPFTYRIEGGAGFRSYEANHYPVHLYGSYNVQTITPYLEYRHYFRFLHFDLDPSVRLTSRHALSQNYQVQDQDRFNPEIPETDFRYLVTDYYKVDLGVKLSRSLRIGRLRETYLDITGSYLHIPEWQENNYDRMLEVSFGLVF